MKYRMQYSIYRAGGVVHFGTNFSDNCGRLDDESNGVLSILRRCALLALPEVCLSSSQLA